MQVPGLYPQTQGTRVPGAQPKGVFLTASRGIVIQSASWATSHFWDPVDSMTSYRQYRVWNSTTTSKKLVFILGITAQLIMLMLLFAWAAGYSEPNLGTLLANEWTLCIFALILFILHSFCFIVLFPPILKKKFKSYCSVCVCVCIYMYIYIYIANHLKSFCLMRQMYVGSEERRGRNGREEGKEEIRLGIRIAQKSHMKLESLLWITGDLSEALLVFVFLSQSNRISLFFLQVWSHIISSVCRRAPSCPPSPLWMLFSPGKLPLNCWPLPWWP